MNSTASLDKDKTGFPTVGGVTSRKPQLHMAVLAAAVVLVSAAFWHSFKDIYNNWQLPDSLYSHALIIPPISLFFVWRLREKLKRAPMVPSIALGLPVLIAGCLMLLLGDFLGFMTFVHLSILPVLTGLCLLFLGTRATRILAFPLAFLFFMIPMPYSLTSPISFQSKMIATESAVAIGKFLTLHMVQDGSFVYLGAGDKLLVGDVCGGMRSLIALLAFGALMAYLSKTRIWARIAILVLSPLVAILANVSRIFFLCVVGYNWGSDAATGLVHDISGIGIFAVAFVLLFCIEAILRKIAPAPERPEESADPAPVDSADSMAAAQSGSALRLVVYAAGIGLLGATAAVHWGINLKRNHAAATEERYANLDLPERIGYYQKIGEDIPPTEDVKAALETSSILMRHYLAPNGLRVYLTLVYAGQKRRSLHFPEVCLVGQGWEVEQAYSAPVGIEFRGKRMVIFKGERKEAVLYWLKTGDQFTSSAFLNNLYWAREQLVFGTPTSAMIKLSMPILPGQDAEDAFSVLDDFATRLGPILLEYIK